MTIELKKRNSGFTLVEMAIVLVIIGIILAGVMKGRDIVRGAQVKQFSQQFAQKWVTIASTYYDKTGQFLLDGEVNGGTTGGLPDGAMDGNLDAEIDDVETQLNSVGIAVCQMIKSKLTGPVAGGVGTPTAHCGSAGVTAADADRVNVVQTLVDGEYAANQIVTLDLINLDITMGGKAYTRNCLLIYNLPVDVCQGLDTAIDGTANGLLGSCIATENSYNAVGPGVAPAPTTTWVSGGDVTTVAWGDAYAANVAQCQTLAIIFDY